MADSNELEALKASFRGAIATAEALAALKDRIESLSAANPPSPTDLDDLARITAAHSIASAALRGLVVTMLARRESSPQA